MENTIIDDDATIVADAPASSKAPATAVSRKEILPAFCITVVAAVALYALMSYLQPMLMNNNFIYDFGTMMTGCIEGSPLYRVAWFFADLTEGSFIAALPASIGMIIMGFVAAATDVVVMSELGRLGLTGPEVIEQEMGKDEFDSADRALVYRTTGGKHKYIMRDCNYLVEDTIASFKEALADVLSKPYDEIVKNRRIGSEELVDEQLDLVELSCEIKPKDARDVWAYFGNEDPAGIPEQTTEEFLRAVKRR